MGYNDSISDDPRHNSICINRLNVFRLSPETAMLVGLSDISCLLARNDIALLLRISLKETIRYSIFVYFVLFVIPIHTISMKISHESRTKRTKTLQ